MLTVAKVVEPKVEVGGAANEVRELPPKPLTVVELELLAVVGKLAAAVDVGADASTGGTETGWPTPEHKDTTTLETATRRGLERIRRRVECGFFHIHTLLVRDIASLFDAGHHLFHKA